ncbi:MAG: hypothetical protein Q7K45_00920 [Nanoarchaeota archaeon]|nr:hypothetical protein [Nanoarchaeota archaeon]
MTKRTKEIVTLKRQEKHIKSYNLAPVVTDQIEKLSYELTKTERGVSGVVQAALEFALDNEADFKAHFRGIKKS